MKGLNKSESVAYNGIILLIVESYVNLKESHIFIYLILSLNLLISQFLEVNYEFNYWDRCSFYYCNFFDN